MDASESDGDARPLDPLDVRAAVAEIEREARARRRAGEIPKSYERELDALFEAIAPVGARYDSVEAVLAQTERIAGFDVTAPTASNIRGGALVKRGLQRAVGWQFHFFASQVQAFAYSTLRAFRLLTDRVVELERRLPVTDARVEAMVTVERDHVDMGPWLAQITSWCAGRPGRVLHAESGPGALVVALDEAGIDAYGVDPRDDAGAVADAAGVETRTTGALDHLRSLPANALGGLVLSGCVDRYALGDQLELARHAMRVLAPGGRLVVLGAHPRHWALHGDPITADLTFGRPLHPETWTHVISGLGFGAIERHDGARATFGERTALSPEVVAALRDVEPLLFPPEAFVIGAVRPAEPGELDVSA